MARQLYVVRINRAYDTGLLDKTVRKAVKPFNGLYDYLGIDPEVWKDDRLAELPKEIKEWFGMAATLWALHSMKIDLGQKYQGRHLLGIFPNPLSYGEKAILGITGDDSISFVSTSMPYLDPANPENFESRMPKVIAHELGHPFGLGHHVSRRKDSNHRVYCLMYRLETTQSERQLDRYPMRFCTRCRNVLNRH